MVKRRLVMPPVMIIPLALFFYHLYRFFCETLVGQPHRVYPLFAAFAAGYIKWDMTHYAIQHIDLKSHHFRMARRNPMRDHWKTLDERFGLTNTFGGFCFGSRLKED